MINYKYRYQLPNTRSKQANISPGIFNGLRRAVDYYTGNSASGTTLVEDAKRVLQPITSNPKVQRTVDYTVNKHGYDPVAKMEQDKNTDQFRQEAINGIIDYTRTGDLKFSPGASVYMSALAREGANTDAFRDALATRLNDHAKTLRTKKDFDSYVSRVMDLESKLTPAMQANAQHLVGTRITEKAYQDRLKAMGNDKIKGAVMGSFSQAFSGDNNPLYGEYMTPEHRQNIKNTMLNGIRAYADGRDHGIKPEIMAQHALLYANDKAYKDAFDSGLTTMSSGLINKNTTPETLMALERRMSSLNPNISMDSIMKLKPEQIAQLMAANKGVIPSAEDIQRITSANINGLTGAMTSGVKKGLFKNWDVVARDIPGFISYASAKKILPAWTGKWAKDRRLFWGSVMGVGGLALGGTALLVNSFLNSRKPNQQQSPVPQQPQQPQIPQTTSYWRAGL